MMDLKKMEFYMNTILDKVDYINVYNILKEHDEKMKVHKNGILVDLTTLSEKSLKLIEYILEYKLKTTSDK